MGPFFPTDIDKKTMQMFDYYLNGILLCNFINLSYHTGSINVETYKHLFNPQIIRFIGPNYNHNDSNNILHHDHPFKFDKLLFNKQFKSCIFPELNDKIQNFN